jgi:molybdate transport system substrate-binding protein
VAAIKKAGIYEKVEPKLVYGENISQAAQFAQSGNAQAGIIALSLAISPAMKDSGKAWPIPAELHPPIEQAAVVTKSSQKKEAAKAFLEYIKSASGKAVMDKYGFTTPPAGDVKWKAA